MLTLCMIMVSSVSLSSAIRFVLSFFILITKVPTESMISSLHSPLLGINESSSFLEENMLEHLEKNIFNNYLMACNI